MPIRRIFDRHRRDNAAHGLYVAIIAQARLPDFYLRLGVPDTLDGRFDLIVAHAFLVMRRLKQESGTATEEARALSQALFDLMFADMDQNLREIGVGDMSVGKKVKQMARAFYGRVASYEDGLAAPADSDVLEAALGRNLYGTVAGGADPGAVAAVAAYLRLQAEALSGQDMTGLLAGKVAFVAPEDAGHGR